MEEKEKKELIEKVLEHWDKMIKYVETKIPYNDVNSSEMRRDIKQAWYAIDCNFCCKYQKEIHGKLNCSDCLLGIYYGSCSEGGYNLWRNVNMSITWGEWLNNAKKFRAQIESLKQLESLREVNNGR